MTISTETSQITAVGDGSNTTFTYDFLIPYQADSSVPAVGAYVIISGVATALTLDTDYSISGVGDEAGGAVEYPLSGSPLPLNDTITIYRVEEFVQPYSFLANGLRPEQIEAMGDWIVMQTQQLNTRVSALEQVVIDLQAQIDAL